MCIYDIKFTATNILQEYAIDRNNVNTRQITKRKLSKRGTVYFKHCIILVISLLLGN